VTDGVWLVDWKKLLLAFCSWTRGLRRTPNTIQSPRWLDDKIPFLCCLSGAQWSGRCKREKALYPWLFLSQILGKKTGFESRLWENN
jgi:hypothetical protein